MSSEIISGKDRRALPDQLYNRPFYSKQETLSEEKVINKVIILDQKLELRQREQAKSERHTKINNFNEENYRSARSLENADLYVKTEYDKGEGEKRLSFLDRQMIVLDNEEEMEKVNTI